MEVEAARGTLWAASSCRWRPSFQRRRCASPIQRRDCATAQLRTVAPPLPWTDTNVSREGCCTGVLVFQSCIVVSFNSCSTSTFEDNNFAGAALRGPNVPLYVPELRPTVRFVARLGAEMLGRQGDEGALPERRLLRTSVASIL